MSNDTKQNDDVDKVRRLMAEAQRLRCILKTYADAMEGGTKAQYAIYHASYLHTALQYQSVKKNITKINLKMLKESQK